MFFSKIKSFISIFIITLLVLGLVLSLGVGTDIVSFGMSDKIIAKVNKEEITLEEFNYFRGLRFSELPKEVLSDKCTFAFYVIDNSGSMGHYNDGKIFVEDDLILATR